MLVRTELHVQIIKPVSEPLQESATFWALVSRRGRTENQSSLPAITEVKDLILQFLEFIVLEPQSFTGLTVIDLKLVSYRWQQVHAAFRAFHLSLRSVHFLTRGKTAMLKRRCAARTSPTRSSTTKKAAPNGAQYAISLASTDNQKLVSVHLRALTIGPT